jgi:hypothetical protein
MTGHALLLIALKNEATTFTPFFRHKSPSPLAEGSCGEKMFAGALRAFSDESAQVALIRKRS